MLEKDSIQPSNGAESPTVRGMLKNTSAVAFQEGNNLPNMP